jgi:DNA polymerase iota
MRVDLLGREDDYDDDSTEQGDETAVAHQSITGVKWLAHPKTLRLSTRPRQPLQSDGSRSRTMKRISHSCPLPNFIFLLNESIETLAEKLVREVLLSMFRKLHPEKTWWNLSLVNIAVTNMAEAAGDSKFANGRDIGTMFKRQDDVLKDFRVTAVQTYMSPDADRNVDQTTEVANTSDLNPREPAEEDEEAGWLHEDGNDSATDFCHTCGSSIPSFAMVAHQRFHSPAVS